MSALFRLVAAGRDRLRPRARAWRRRPRLAVVHYGSAAGVAQQLLKSFRNEGKVSALAAAQNIGFYVLEVEARI